MRILMATSEVLPYSKTGGLADVSAALPRALAALGHEVAVVTPLYGATQLGEYTVASASLSVAFGDAVHFPRILTKVDAGVRMYFVDYPPFFQRDGLYFDERGDFADNPERFTLLSRAAIEIAKQEFHPDVVHCHDWQTAMVPVLLKSRYWADPYWSEIPCLFTIHNLAYQGSFPPEVLARIGLGNDVYNPNGVEFYERVNMLKGALMYSDAISTVSEGYAREIQTKEFGCGMEGVLKHRAADVSGILNGVEYADWDPAHDPHIAANYDAGDMDGKSVCKEDLLREFDLPTTNLDRAVVGIVSRFAVQKGFDLIEAAMEQMLGLDIFLTVLGSGDQRYVDTFREMAARAPDRVAVKVAYSEQLAHKIEAGSDLFLMPSQYEPCGLNQMYSLRYGTVPVVRATGGLDDTITNFDPLTGEGTGFKFSDYTPVAMMGALWTALQVYPEKPAWTRLIENGMAQDYSWAQSATKYVNLYERLVDEKR